jgi:hypothetical protein
MKKTIKSVFRRCPKNITEVTKRLGTATWGNGGTGTGMNWSTVLIADLKQIMDLIKGRVSKSRH